MADKEKFPVVRFYFIITILLLALLGLIVRIIDLGVIERNFLVKQGAARSIREITIPSHRGMIVDRNGEPLAVSALVASIWINPQIFEITQSQFTKLAKILAYKSSVLKEKVYGDNGDKEFVYLKRGVPPEVAKQVLNLNIRGVFSQNEYKRYYPEAEVMAHVIGFTNIDDDGQEGLELAYQSWLKGIPGKMRVLKDRLGNIIENLAIIRKPQEGQNLMLSLDRRVQYLAYRELKDTVEKYKADSGSIVVLDVKTGEVIAMVNQPSYNPNNRNSVPINYFRNRAVTDLFEPGSTMKAFSIACALANGKFQPTTIINTNPGVLKIDDHQVYDDEHLNNGILTVTEVLKKSSNIGVAKMILSLPSDFLLNFLRNIGFGETTQSGFPGEGRGSLPNNLKWRPFVLATLSFGYSISTTPLQLAQAYAVIASSGLLRPISFLKLSQPSVSKEVLDPTVAKQMLKMLQTVLDIGGTGTRAHIPGYSAAGKTGTAYIAGPHGYYTDKYFSMFVGIAPVSDPELVVVVVIKNPRGSYYGGLVAAPVFAHVMEGALRILGVPQDET
jgi:cell division protein FtsI (penicillin-binding protein 3)